VNFRHSVQPPHRVLRLTKKLRPRRTSWARHRHLDFDIRLAFGLLVDLDVVDQTQVDNVHEQLGIDNALQRFTDFVFSNWHLIPSYCMSLLYTTGIRRLEQSETKRGDRRLACRRLRERRDRRAACRYERTLQ